MLRDPKLSPNPMPRNDWLADFMSAAFLLRPDASRTLLHSAAVVAYVTHSGDNPQETGRAWAGENKLTRASASPSHPTL